MTSDSETSRARDGSNAAVAIAPKIPGLEPRNKTDERTPEEIIEELVAFQKRVESLLGNDEFEYHKKFNQKFDASIDYHNENLEKLASRRYPEDSYTFIAVGWRRKKRTSESVEEYNESGDIETGMGDGVNSARERSENEYEGTSPFLFVGAIIVWLLQISLTYVIARGMMPEEKMDVDLREVLDFSNFVRPTKTIHIARTLSIISYFFVGGDTIDDWKTATRLLADTGFDFCGHPFHLLSIFMRSIAMFFALNAAMTLTFESKSEVEIILNFAAVYFISSFDDLFYFYVKDGVVYGERLAADVKSIETKERPERANCIKPIGETIFRGFLLFFACSYLSLEIYWVLLFDRFTNEELTELGLTGREAIRGCLYCGISLFSACSILGGLIYWAEATPEERSNITSCCGKRTTWG